MGKFLETQQSILSQEKKSQYTYNKKIESIISNSSGLDGFSGEL